MRTQPIKFFTPTIRKTAAAAMFATSVLVGGGYAMAKPAQTTAQTTTQTVATYPSEQASAAMKSNAVNTPAVSMQRNKKLEQMFLKFAENEADKKIIMDFCNDTYKNYGAFLGSIQIQRMIDMNALDNYLQGNVNNFIDSDLKTLFYLDNNKQIAGVKKARPQTMSWFNDTYSTAFTKKIGKTINNKGQNKLSFEACSKMLDEFVENELSKVLPKEAKEAYYADSKAFRDSQREKNTVQAQSDYLAYKVFLIDALSAYANLKSVNAFNENYKSSTGKGQSYYYMQVMQCVSPTN